MTETKFTFAELRALRSSAERRDKVTKTLASAVEKVADEITTHGEVGDEAQVLGMSLAIRELRPMKRPTKILEGHADWYDEDDHLHQSFCFNAASSYPDDSMYYYQDFNGRVAVPNRAAILMFAENAGSIVHIFRTIQDRKSVAAEKAAAAMPEAKDE